MVEQDIVVDEIHMFQEIEWLITAKEAGKNVIVAGLEKTSAKLEDETTGKVLTAQENNRRNPIGRLHIREGTWIPGTQRLMEVANEVVHLKAICIICGKEAEITLRYQFRNECNFIDDPNESKYAPICIGCKDNINDKKMSGKEAEQAIEKIKELAKSLPSISNLSVDTKKPRNGETKL